jgi:hypothetical protein
MSAKSRESLGDVGLVAPEPLSYVHVLGTVQVEMLYATASNLVPFRVSVHGDHFDKHPAMIVVYFFAKNFRVDGHGLFREKFVVR